jgi:hypothetical protein
MAALQVATPDRWWNLTPPAASCKQQTALLYYSCILSQVTRALAFLCLEGKEA